PDPDAGGTGDLGAVHHAVIDPQVALFVLRQHDAPNVQWTGDLWGGHGSASLQELIDVIGQLQRAARIPTLVAAERRRDLARLGSRRLGIAFPRGELGRPLGRVARPRPLLLALLRLFALGLL